MKIKEIKVYSLSELPEKAKEKALCKLADFAMQDDWWYKSTYEDAKTIGMKITAFDVDRGNIDIEYVESATEVADAIIKNHGESCGTHTAATAYLKERDEIVDTAPKDEDGELESEYDLDQKLDELDEEFLKTLGEEYLSMLRKERDAGISKSRHLVNHKTTERKPNESQTTNGNC